MANIDGTPIGETLTGTSGADVIRGFGGNDILIGLEAADQLEGGIGDDTYYVDNAGDLVTELAGEGFDAVYTSVSYALAAGAEVEWLSASTNYGIETIHLTGNELANLLIANQGDNILNGGGGADVLIGLGGQDVYYVDNVGDQVRESAGGGYDAVYTSVSYTLAAGAEVEWLSSSTNYGTEAIGLTGNEFANVIIANEGANVLNGGGGADVLIGLGGNDAYYVDNAADQARESAGGGFDAVYTTVSYRLAAGTEIEWLSTSTVYGTEAISLVGNEYNNYLLANEGANLLNGGVGADVMIGYGGNDTYIVDSSGDGVAEAAGGGFDAIYTNVSYALSAGVELEWLSADAVYGTAAINLTGNEFANFVLGNDGSNVLNGGAGADMLYGYGGADVFAFTTALGGGNVDTIFGFVAGSDRIGLDDAIFTAIGGTLSPDAFVIGAAAAGTEDRIVYNQATGQLFYDADGSGGGAAILFATLQDAPVLGAGDFTMI